MNPVSSAIARAAQIARAVWEWGPGPRGRARLGQGARSFMGFDARLLGDLPAVYSDPTGAARTELARVRAEARWQAQGNPYAVQARRSLITNVIGPRGVQLRAQIPLGGRRPGASSPKSTAMRDMVALLKSGEQAGDKLNTAVDRLILAQATLEKDDELNAIVEDEWRKFCRPSSFDLAGRSSFHQFELSIVGAFPSHGGALVRIIRKAAPGMPADAPQICFQLINTSQLDEKYNGVSQKPGHYWHAGIEIDSATGRLSRYAILRVHPNSTEYGNPARGEPKHVFVDANDIIHVFIPQEIGQLREMPWLASVLPTLHNINEYEKSHWTRKRVAANLLGFIRKNDDGVAPIGTALVDEEEDTGELISRSSPGQWVTLAPGEDPIAPQFGQDDQMFGEVLKTMLRRFSSGFGTNYSTNSRDYSDVNYTSIRMSLIEDRDWFKVIQSLLIQLFHQRVYEEWFKAAMLSGQLPTARFGNYWTDPDLFLTPRWQARTWVGADPSKDMEAYRDAQRLGLQSTADQIAESYGEDLEHVWAQIAYELALRKRLGLPVVLDGVYETVSNAEQPPGSSEQVTT